MKKLGVYSIFTMLIFSSLGMLIFSSNNTILFINEGIDEESNLNLPKTSDDGYEPNDNFAGARTIAIGYHPNLWSGGNEDWFRFSMISGQRFMVVIYYDEWIGHLNSELKNNADSHLLYGNYDGSTKKLIYNATYSGDYFIRIYNFEASQSYDLSISLEEVIFEDDFESGIKSEWSGFGGDNYWHITDSDWKSFSHSLWCGNESSGVYNKQNATFVDLSYQDVVVLENLNFLDYRKAFLKLNYHKDTNSDSDDHFKIIVRVSSQNLYLNPRYSVYEFEAKEYSDQTDWGSDQIDISALCGYDKVDLKFVFSCDAYDNWYSGVYIDDINITGFKDTFYDGINLGVHEGDVFIYQIEYMDQWKYENVFGMPAFGDEEDKLKLEIDTITSTAESWLVNVYFWEPGKNFDSYGAAYSWQYKIYKMGVNKKGNLDFIIPNNNPNFYLQKADNVEGSPNFDSNHWRDSHWDDYLQREVTHYSFNLRLEEIWIHLSYDEDGILNWFSVEKYGEGDIYSFYLDKDEDYNYGPDFNMNDLLISIPGYDLMIIISILLATMSLLTIKIRKSFKK